MFICVYHIEIIYNWIFKCFKIHLTEVSLMLQKENNVIILNIIMLNGLYILYLQLLIVLFQNLK